MIEKTHINPVLLNHINTVFDDIGSQKKAMLFCLATFADCTDILYEWGIMQNEEDEHHMRIALLERNVDTDSLQAKYRLRFPLFAQETEQDLFDVYHKALVMRFKTLPQSSRLFGNAKTREAFKALQMRHKDFDVQRMIDATINYYLKEDYLKNLDGFLDDLGDTKYMAWEKQKSKIL